MHDHLQHNDQQAGTIYSKSLEARTTGQTAKQTTKYLVIKEWNVRFPIPAGLEDNLYYQKLDSQEFEAYEILSNTIDLDNCAPISVFRTQKSGFGTITIDNFYYGQRKGVQACDTQASEKQREAAEVQERLAQALEKLEKNP